MSITYTQYILLNQALMSVFYNNLLLRKYNNNAHHDIILFYS